MRENQIAFEMQQNEPEDHFGTLLLLCVALLRTDARRNATSFWRGTCCRRTRFLSVFVKKTPGTRSIPHWKTRAGDACGLAIYLTDRSQKNRSTVNRAGLLTDAEQAGLSATNRVISCAPSNPTSSQINPVSQRPVKFDFSQPQRCGDRPETIPLRCAVAPTPLRLLRNPVLFARTMHGRFAICPGKKPDNAGALVVKLLHTSPALQLMIQRQPVSAPRTTVQAIIGGG